MATNLRENKLGGTGLAMKFSCCHPPDAEAIIGQTGSYQRQPLATRFLRLRLQYAQSTMPYHGVPTPLLRTVCKELFADVQFKSAADWQAQVLDLWRNARLREERYAALHLAGHKRARPFQTPAESRTWRPCPPTCN